MPKPETLIVDGHGLSWRRVCDRRQQLAAWRAEEARQLALFEMQGDGARVLPL